MMVLINLAYAKKLHPRRFLLASNFLAGEELPLYGLQSRSNRKAMER
jgi:hypothetical protein